MLYLSPSAVLPLGSALLSVSLAFAHAKYSSTRGAIVSFRFFSLSSGVVKRHFLSGVNGGLQSVTVESNGILYSQAAGCQQYNGMFS
jgi:hypothetical protein